MLRIGLEEAGGCGEQWFADEEINLDGVSNNRRKKGVVTSLNQNSGVGRGMDSPFFSNFEERLFKTNIGTE